MAVTWLAMLQGGMEPPYCFATSGLLAAFAGPFALMFQLPIREFGVLPVSRRDVWRARWLESTVVAAAVTATGKSFAMALGPFFWPWMSLRPDLLLLSTSVDISMLGVTASLMAWLARRRTATPGRLA